MDPKHSIQFTALSKSLQVLASSFFGIFHPNLLFLKQSTLPPTFSQLKFMKGNLQNIKSASSLKHPVCTLLPGESYFFLYLWPTILLAFKHNIPCDHISFKNGPKDLTASDTGMTHSRPVTGYSNHFQMFHVINNVVMNTLAKESLTADLIVSLG